MKEKFRLDKTASATLQFKDADKAISCFHDYTWKERLIVANYLISVAYNFSLNNHPKMDKTHFEIHQHNG